MAETAPEDERYRPRLIVTAHWNPATGTFGNLTDLLSGGDIATIVFVIDGTPDNRSTDALKGAVGAVQRQEVAAVIFEHSQLVGRTGADGLLLDGNIHSATEIAEQCDALHPDRFVGAVAPFSRHEAMVLAESECDFIQFGRPGSDSHEAVHPKILDLAAWWVELFQIPVVAHLGAGMDGVEMLTKAGTDFILADQLIWRDGKLIHE